MTIIVILIVMPCIHVDRQRNPRLFNIVVALFCLSGTRYRRRGVDDNGDVANFVETEQVLTGSSVSSRTNQVALQASPYHWFL